MRFDDLPSQWEADPHTLAKLRLYRRYIDGWFPILFQGGFRQAVIVDGFAGPGTYRGGEDGSPIVALKAILEHNRRDSILVGGKTIDLLFIEARPDRYELLRAKVDSLPRHASVHPQVVSGTFVDVWGRVLERFEIAGKAMAPVLVLIDPFGPTGFPMSLVERVASHRSSEVLINLAYQSLNRWWLSDPSKFGDVDEIFGGSGWRRILELPPAEREKELVLIYQAALAAKGWHGIAYQMVNRLNQTQYYLVFGTQSERGMQVFKDAAWAVSQDGGFRFSDTRNPGQVAFLAEVTEQTVVDDLKSWLFVRFQGRTVPMEELAQAAAFHPTAASRHLRPALLALETGRPPQITAVDVPSGRRRGVTYPNGSLITFQPSV